eukprot:UN12699
MSLTNKRGVYMAIHCIMRDHESSRIRKARFQKQNIINLHLSGPQHYEKSSHGKHHGYNHPKETITVVECRKFFTCLNKAVSII